MDGLPDGLKILYASSRETAPSDYERLWTVRHQGEPSKLLPAPVGHDGSMHDDAKRIVVDRRMRINLYWRHEWRHYRGGQNVPLSVLDLESLEEVHLPNERSTDAHPTCIGDAVYFLSDRNWSMNIWRFDLNSHVLSQITHFDDVDIKWLDGHGSTLVFERDGYIHTVDVPGGETHRLKISARGDFPWMEPQWQDVTDQIRLAAFSPAGKHALFEARGDIFTFRFENARVRNLTRSSGTADRSPIWSGSGTQVAWFSNSGKGYKLLIASPDGQSVPRSIDIGVSKMAWQPVWSPDGKWIAFGDDAARIRIVDCDTGDVVTADTSEFHLDGSDGMGLAWSPDSRWLAYSKTFANNLHRIVVWSVEKQRATTLTNGMADARSPCWDHSGKYLYLLASTNVGRLGGMKTSSIGVRPKYSLYMVQLAAADAVPFSSGSGNEVDASTSDTSVHLGVPGGGRNESPLVSIEFENIHRRILALPVTPSDYSITLPGPAGTVFIGKRKNKYGDEITLHKFSLNDGALKVFIKKVGDNGVVVSSDGKRLLYHDGSNWLVSGTDKSPEPEHAKINVSLNSRLDRGQEWRQIFEEAWRYMRDYFYAPNMHGRDWDAVYARYAPLVSHVRHRADLNYVLHQMSGERSVGHGFVFGGDMPAVDKSGVGALGVDLVPSDNRWCIKRILRRESWNPTLRAPLDHPEIEVEEGQYILAVNGVELTAEDDPYRLLDGTVGQQTELLVNHQPILDEAWTVTVKPLKNENSLRTRTWVEDNRRRVNALSNGKLAYVWLPDTDVDGIASFDRYFFAQQDKFGAVIDERFNGGGHTDDYMVSVLRPTPHVVIPARIAGGRLIRFPPGVQGPKVLVINERSVSGGDFFAWAFREEGIGPLIGRRTWGAMVSIITFYPLVDGGRLSAPIQGHVDPNRRKWIGENEGIPPDIEVVMDAKSVSQGQDPQLNRAVQEALRLLTDNPSPSVHTPPFPAPAKRPSN